MKKKQKSSLFFYSFIIFLFLLDISFFLFFEKPIFSALLCFYIINTINHANFLRLTTCILLLILEFFIYYGNVVGINLIALIPATLAGFQAGKMFYESRLIYYALLIMTLLIQIGVIEHMILKLPISIPYTISQIIANMIIMMLLRSLK
jgi:hypothetical protein